MPDTLARLEALVDAEEVVKPPFGAYEEEAIISLALEHPEFCTVVMDYLQPEMFKNPVAQYIWVRVKQAYEKFKVIPTRLILRDMVLADLSEDDPHEKVLDLINRPANHREVPIIKDTLLKWARDKAYGLLYSDEAQDAYNRGDYEFLENIIKEANRIVDLDFNGFWFFQSYPLLFQPDVMEHRTTGFSKLDAMLNNGGPSPKEVVCYLAATNVGKSIVLCNNAISSLKGPGPNGTLGQDVLLITFELDYIKTAMRCLGVMTQNVPIAHLGERQEYATRIITQHRETYKKELLIIEWPPEECSVNNIYALLESLKRSHNWHPDVIILDYLDLMVSRNSAYNVDDYTRQKHVANEVRGLAKNEDVLIFTATQTNRSGMSGAGEEERGEGRNQPRPQKMADLNSAAESFAKQFALDYVVSLNQTQSQRKATPPRMYMYIAKNRNGPKNETIECTIEYDKMVVRESP